MDELISHALKDYKAEFQEDFDPTWVPTTHEDLADKLRSSQVDFNTWRSKHATLWRTLSAVALPISNLGRIASDMASAANPPTAAAVSGLLSLVAACEKVSEAYDFVEQMFAKLEDALSRWKLDSKHQLDEMQKQKIQQILLVILSIITRSRKLVRRGRARHYLARLVFGEDEKTSDLMNNLELLLQSEDRARLAITLDKLNALWEKAIRTESASIVERLNSSAVTVNNQKYGSMLEDKLVGSGMWFREEQLYQRWIQNDLQLLLLLGGPGSGKSYLAAGLVEDLIQKHHRDSAKAQSTSTAFFFFNQEHNLTAMLKTLAYQIQAVNRHYRQHVVEVFDQGDLYTAKEVWTKLFLEYWNDEVNPHARVVLVIDGLNEASSDEMEIFANDMVKSVRKGFGHNIQIALFGRLQLWDDFDFVPRERFIMLEPQKTQADISAYVDQKLLQIRVLKKKSPERKAELRDKILERCEGVFEWARQLLAKCKNKEEHHIRKLLQNPPKDLQDMIKSCFDQIMADDDVDPAMLRPLLTWLAYERRPLRFGELYNAVRLTTGEDYTLMWRNIVRNLSSVLLWRTSRGRQWTDQDVEDDEDHIEMLDEEEGWSKQTSKIWISFGNSLIREYVVSQSRSDDTDHDFWPLSSQQSESDIVKVCLQTLRRHDVLEKKNRFLLIYPLRFMLQHIQNLDMEVLSHDDRSEIASGLIWMFHNESGHRAIAINGSGSLHEGNRIFWRMWIETSENVKLTQSWLQWALDSGLDIDEKAKAWVAGAATSVKVFFRPLAAFLRHTWLAKDWSPAPTGELADWLWIVNFAVPFLATYDNMDEQECWPERYQRYYLIEGFNPRTKDVLASAGGPGIHKNADYHVTLALTFSSYKKSSLAIEHTDAVSEADCRFWAAAWMRAGAYANQGNADQALYWSKIAADLNPHDRAKLNSTRSKWFLMKNEASNAVDAVQEAYDQNPLNEFIQLTYLRSLTVVQDSATIIRVIRASNEQFKGDSPYSQLVEGLLSYISGQWLTGLAMGHAYLNCQSQDDKTFILDALEKTSALVAQHEGEKRQIEWYNQLAIFKYRYIAGCQKASVTQLVASLAKIRESRFLPDPAQKNEMIIGALCRAARWAYILAVEQETVSDPEVSSTLNILEKLTLEAEELDKTSLSAGRVVQAYLGHLYYGHWLRTHKTDSDENWKRYLRPPLMYFLDMLDDSSSHNDYWGVAYTRRILTFAGDTENAAAIRSITVRRYRQKNSAEANKSQSASQTTYAGNRLNANPSPKTTQQENEAEKELSDGVSSLRIEEAKTVKPSEPDEESEYSSSALNLNIDVTDMCSSCSSECSYVDEMYSCDICTNTYCKKCLPTTRIHPVFGRECGVHHTFSQFWPVQERHLHIATVNVGDSVRIRRSWLNKIREEWKAPDDVAGQASK